jgi:hypothetical protein
MPEPELMSVAECIRASGESKAVLIGHIKRRNLRSFRLGRKVWVTRSSFQRWASERQSKADPGETHRPAQLAKEKDASARKESHHYS